MGIYDSATGKSFSLCIFTTSKVVSTGDVLRFNASAIDITLN